MDEKITRESHVQSVCDQIVQTAQAMLDEQVSYLLGARKLDALRHIASVSWDDADFLVFTGIASEVDALPLGPVRELWDKQALEKLQPEIDAAEIWAKQYGEATCVKLIKRFS